jgi:predicted metal-dependent peptidase
MTETHRIISEEEKALAIQSAVYYLTAGDKSSNTAPQPFYGSFLQELTIKYSEMVPTAGITYNQKLSQYEIFINPNYFCNLKRAERVAVFHHEVLHFTNKHLFRLPFLDKKTKDEDRKLYNIAGDMAINQYIPNLPEGCVDVKQWKKDDGAEFPTLQNMESYYDLIKNQSKQQKQNNQTKGNVNENLDKYKEFDQHFWDDLDEETKKKMLEEAKKIIKRTVEKSSFGNTNVPNSVKDLLIEIDSLTTEINYKQILKSTIKKTVSCADRENTWKRPNRRYGIYSPGLKIGELPNLTMLVDTSGSISLRELNEFLHIISEFLKVGTRNCQLALWHTELYYKKKYKLGTELDKSELQSGGTNITCALEDIKKTNPNLAIILTDGYYDVSDVKVNSEIIWIISKGGNVNHPMKHMGKTIELDKIK